MKVSPTAVARKRRNLAWRILEGEAIIVSSRDSQIHSLNRVGTRIWELCDGKTSVRDISKALCHEFDVAPRRALSDTAEFIGELLSKGIVGLGKAKTAEG